MGWPLRIFDNTSIANNNEHQKARKNATMATINNNAKNVALRLLKRFFEPYNCWTKIKNRHEAPSGPRIVALMNSFVHKSQQDNVSMDAYLSEVKEVVASLDEADIEIPKPLVVYMTIHNSPMNTKSLRESP